MDVGDDGVAMDMGGDGIAEEPPDSATSLSNMIDRIDSQVSNVGRFPESDSESEPTALADGRYDDREESPLGNHGGIDEAIVHAGYGVPPDVGAVSTQPPRLENIHTLAPPYRTLQASSWKEGTEIFDSTQRPPVLVSIRSARRKSSCFSFL